MSKTPKSPPKNTLPLRDRWLVGALLVLVVCLATLQLFRDLKQVNWGHVLAELPGITEENTAAASRPADPVTKATFITDNYHLCQNKAGMELFWLQTGEVKYNNIPIAQDVLGDKLDQIMKEQFLAGAKYFSVHMYSYTEQDRSNLIVMLEKATNRQLTPILLPEVVGTDDADTLVNLYTALAEAVPNAQFVGGSVPEAYMDNGDFVGAVHVANEVADRLKNVKNVAVGTPVMFPHDDPNQDRMHHLRNVGGLTLEPFDFLLIKIRNSDYKFDGTLDPAFKYQSDYSQTAYYRFSELINKDTGMIYFKAKQWLRDNNNQDFRQHMQAIVLEFGLQDGTYTPEGNKLQNITLQRLEDDFARFGADPDVRAVVFAGPQTVPYELGTSEITRLNLASTNCNYNIEDSGFTYSSLSKAPVCATEKVGITNSNDNYTEAPVVCDPDSYNCSGEIIYTVQVGLPVKHFGSNSPAGTDTNPHMPISTVVGNNTYLNYLNPYNQYGQAVIPSSGQAYVVPWLGSALYNSSELLRTQFYAAKDPKLLAALPINDLSSSAEYTAKLNSGYSFDKKSPYDYRTKTLWCFNGLRSGVENADASSVNLFASRSPVLTPDEFALYIGKGFCVAKDQYTAFADSFQSFDIDKQSNEFKAAPVCGDTVIKTDPQNMVYGAEQVLKKETWQGTGDDLCYDAWRGGRDLVGGRNLNCSLYTDPSLNRKPDNSTPPAGLICNCNENIAAGYQRVSFTPANIKNGACTLSMEQVRFCMDYNGGADSLLTSTVKLHKTNFPGTDGAVPNYDIPGAYSALASLYKHVQDQFSQKGLKLVFKEDWGWQSDVVLRAYMTASGPQSTLPQPRESLMTDVPIRNYGSLADALGAPKGQLGSSANPGTTSGSKSSSSCKIGVNLAIPASSVGDAQINEAADIGYGAAQVIINSASDVDSAKKTLDGLCQKGITPVVRSCVIGNCGFDNGENQAKVLNDITDVPACNEIYVTCGHNEPIAEYAPGMVAEGQWTRDCVRNVDTRGGKVKIAASIFNATYGDGNTDVVDHARDFISGYGAGEFNADKSKIACIGLNTYDVKSGSSQEFERAEFYYKKTMTAVPEFSGMGGCVMETGSLNSKSAGDMVDLVRRLGSMSGIQFMLGFNWTNTNSGWEQFAIDDKGRAAVKAGCSGGTTSVNNVGGAEYLSKWNGYMANGKNWEMYHQYYEMLGLIDELTKVNDVLARTDLLAGGGIVESEVASTVRYQEFLADIFSGWYGCGSPAHKAFGEKTNCIGLLGDRDPLGEFLCKKGYNVTENCFGSGLQCIPDVENTSGMVSTVTSLQNFQPGLVSFTNRVESIMCLPKGMLLAMMEREITGQIKVLDGSPFQQLYPSSSGRSAWGPAMFTNIAWRDGNNPAYGKTSGAGFIGSGDLYGTKECLDALGIDYTNPDRFEEQLSDSEYVLDRSYVAYALCGAAAKLKNDSGTGAKCSNWTLAEVLNASRSYLGDCSQSSRPYCQAYPETLCATYPQENQNLCGGVKFACNSDGEIDELSPDSGIQCPGAPLNGTDYSGSIIWPIEGASEANFSPNGHFEDPRSYSCPTEGYHTGIDIVSPQGTPVLAVADGYVMDAGLGIEFNDASAPYGNFIKIQHGTYFYTLYGHLDQIHVAKGQQVKQGQLIGTVGSTTYDKRTGFNHLHFEIRRFCICKCNSRGGSCWIDPLSTLQNGTISPYVPPTGGGDSPVVLPPAENPGSCNDVMPSSPEILNVPGYTINTSSIQNVTANRRALTCEGNFGRELIAPRGVVLHWTAGAPLVQRSGTLKSMRAEEISYNGQVYLRPSAQFFVSVEGEIYQIAYTPNYFQNHATGFSWNTIGIENEGRGEADLTPAQVTANAALIRALKAKYPSIEYLIGHDQADNIAYSSQCSDDFKQLVLPSRLSGGIGCKGDVGLKFLSSVGDQLPLRYCSTTSYNCISP